MDANERNSSDNNLRQRASIRKCCDQISLSNTLKLSSLMLSLMLETGWQVSLPLKVLHTESRDAIPLRGEGCNTLGVCHQLSNGFELKHGILSDDEDVKVKPIETSPNLNLDIAPLLAYRPLFKIYAWVVWLGYLHVSHINTHLYWTLKKFHDVWNQKVTWNDKLYPCWNDFTKCLNCTIKWMRTWDVNQTLQPCQNDSRWTLQQKSWKVHVGQMPRKRSNGSKRII